jgi:hypothetical protein
MTGGRYTEPAPLGEPEGITHFVNEWRHGWWNSDEEIRAWNRQALVAQLRRLIDTGGLDNRAPMVRSPSNGA